MPHPHPKRSIDMLYQGKVVSFDDVFFDERSVVQGYFFRILEQSGVREAEFSFESSFFSSISTE